MKLRLLAVPAVVLLATAVSACGAGSDTLSLEEYFAQYSAIDADAATEFVEAPSDFEGSDSASADETNLAFFRYLFSEYERINRDRLAGLTGLSPPPEVADTHGEVISALENLIAVVDESNEAVQDAETMAEFETLNLEPGLEVAAVAFEVACGALGDIAEANDIAVVLTCAVDG